MTPSDREGLRALAEKATPGPWQHNGSHIYGPDPRRDLICQVLTDYGHLVGDRDYITAANPATVRALLDENERMREALERVADYQWPVIIGHRMVPFSVPETGYHSETKEAVPSESPLQALKAVSAIARAALPIRALSAAPRPIEGEPVAWRFLYGNAPEGCWSFSWPKPPVADTNHKRVEPLYAAPPAPSADIFRDHLTWVLPMAKGYAAQHPVGSNAEIVAAAGEALAQPAPQEGGDAGES